MGYKFKFSAILNIKECLSLLIQFVKFSFGQNIGACINDHTKFKTHFKQFKFFLAALTLNIFNEMRARRMIRYGSISNGTPGIFVDV